MEENKDLVTLTKEEACKSSNSMLTNLYYTTKPESLDMPLLDFVLTNAFGNGAFWYKEQNKTQLKEIEAKGLNAGIWLAITEIAFNRGYNGLIEDIIKAVGFTYDECLELMESSGCNNEILQPIVNSIFNVEEEVLSCDFPEDVEIYLTTP
ncbi:hypothetical protein [Parabacteroides sp. PF5-9]|uniref:hypothetical protein n=1 Tax=Parabacteroides sp. PF5-9 TaxID=1742404 RepID=UPI00247370EF|nr:hypothetical protein [Parabacteroides sp. PF5-9]MDH6357220.1 hypothetical protein [Parabacteroides sp. PF5-9]